MNIVITGASNGIGYHTARLLSQGGKHTVYAMARSRERLQKLSSEAGSDGGNIVAVEVDLANEDSRNAACDAVMAKAAHVDVLVHNAGYLVNKAFADLTDADWMDIYTVNVLGPAAITRRFLPHLRGGAHVVHISSMGGVQGSQKFPGLSAYSSAKGAIAVLTESLAEELRSDGISVNCLALGSVDTEMFAAAFPGGRAAMKPADMARFIAYFALNGKAFFNGKILPVTATTP